MERLPHATGPAREELQRPQRQAYRLRSPRSGVQFHPSHGDWISILRSAGFAIAALHELYAPVGADPHPFYQLVTAGWAANWPAEEVWVAHLAS